MPDIDLQPIIEYFSRHLLEHGPGARGMDWKDESSQHLRFDIINRYIDFDPRPSVVDVGCGSGEYRAYAESQGHSFQYLGLDVCPQMVAACCDRFGPQACTLGSTSALRTMQGSFDYAIASGTFNAKLDLPKESWEHYVLQSIREMFEACRIAVIVNLMTPFVDFRYDRLYYASLETIAAFATDQLSRRFLIDHNYPLYEMTVVIYRHPPDTQKAG